MNQSALSERVKADPETALAVYGMLTGTGKVDDAEYPRLRQWLSAAKAAAGAVSITEELRDAIVASGAYPQRAL